MVLFIKVYEYMCGVYMCVVCECRLEFSVEDHLSFSTLILR